MALGVIGLSVTAHDRILTEVLPAGCWNDASRAGPQFRKIKGPKVLINRGFKIPHLIEGGKRIDISM